MKRLLPIIPLLLLVSCGLTEKIKCGSDIEMGCNAIFGMKNTEQDQRLDNNDTKNTEQDNRIKALEEQNLSLIGNLNYISSEIVNLQAEVDANLFTMTTLDSTQASQIAALQAANVTINNTITTNAGIVTSFQNLVNANLVTLNAYVSAVPNPVVGVIDPCGDSPGFDEVLLKTKDGKYTGYFEQGSKRYLTVIQNGYSYVTTDGSNCHFSISSTGVLTY